MASNILNQIYKEAKTTSKGVIQMNRTLNLIYEDQEKGNKRQEKFLADLKNRQRREEREEKRRQSDLKKMIAGKAVTAKKGEDEVGGDGKGILGAITDGLGQVFGLLKDLLIGAILKRLAGFLRLPGNPFRPRPGGSGGKGNGGKGNKGNKPGGNKPGGNKPGGNKPGGTKPGGTNPNVKPGVQPGGTKPGGTKPQTAPNVGKPGGPQPLQAPKPPPATPPKNTGGFRGLLSRIRNFIFKNPRTAGKLKNINWKGIRRGGITALAMVLADIFMPELQDGVAQIYSRLGIETIRDISDAKLTYQYLSEVHTRAELNKNQPFKDIMGDQFEALPGDRLALLEREFKRRELEIPEYDGKKPVEPKKLQKGGGVFDVPGHGQGDQVPMMLPPGAFVLNRVAAGEMFARGGSPSGMVPTLLEPGEKVFMPGDPLMDMAMSFNSTFSRFQKGGMAGQPSSDTASEKITDRGLNQLSGKGGSQAVVSVGKMLLDEGFTVKEHPNFAGRSFNKEGTARVGGHSQNSLHYKNLAIDVTDWREGAWQQRTATLAEKMYRQRKELNLTQIIHDPWGAWFAGEGQKGPGIGGHETHLHLGFASGPASDKGYVGKGDANTPGNNDKQKEKDGLFGAIGSAIGSIFSPITDAITGAMESGPFAQLTKQMTQGMSDMMSELQSPEAQEQMEKIKSAISNQVKNMNVTGKSPSEDHMKKIRQAMDPDTEETVVQVVPSQEKQVEPTISGQTSNNVPTGLTTRCSSWASADYRYDRSLNTETL